MTSISLINAYFKQAHIADQLAAKKIRADYMAGVIGPNTANQRFRELMAASREKVQA